MKQKIFILTMTCLLFPLPCFSIDLDDGIDIDDSIDKYHEMDKLQKNITYTILKATSQTYAKGGSVKADENTISAVNSVVIKSGGIVQGDIIIIDKSGEDHTAIAK